MRLYLIRHGDVSEDDMLDPPLSVEGRETASRGAELLFFDGGSLDLLLCSPLRRAVEHATVIAERTGGVVNVQESLEPEGDFSELIDSILRSDVARVAVVGHLPQLKRIASMLISESEHVDIRFDKGGIASVEVDAVSGLPKGELRWVVGGRMLDIFPDHS